MPKLRNIHIVSNAYSECVPTPVDYRQAVIGVTFSVLIELQPVPFKINCAVKSTEIELIGHEIITRTH